MNAAKVQNPLYIKWLEDLIEVEKSKPGEISKLVHVYGRVR